MERCPTTSRVISVRCQFCVYRRFEDNPTKLRKRGPKTTNMTWTGSFRSDNYRHHHDTQHPSQWAAYQLCSFIEKSQFFTGVTPHANTMLKHINIATPLKFNIQAPIIDVLIGDMFFHPDDQGETTQKNALKLFKRVDGRIDRDYEVVLLNPDQFKLVVANVSGGVSFRQCVRIHDDIKDILRITFKTRQFTNRCHPNWKPHGHQSRWICKNCPCTQSPSYRHYS